MRSVFINKLFGLLFVPNCGQLAFPSDHSETHWRVLRGWFFWSCLGFFASLSGAIAAFTLGADGLSIVSHKPLSWDFSNLWFGGRLAIEGQVQTLFDVDGYRAAMRATLSPHMANSEWSYPPSILLVGAPLAFLPLPLAWLVWTAGGYAALAVFVRSIGLPWRALPVLLLSAAPFDSFILGQNGAFTAALLMGGLWLAPKRPVWAGLLFGLLAFKPQFGVLIPFCLIAGRHWRALFFGALFTFGLAALSALLFGPAAWIGFFEVTRPLMTSILEAPFLQPYQCRVITIFAVVRGLGGTVGLAYAGQGISAAICILLAYHLWSRPGVDPFLRLSATAALTLLATPYGYSYDMVALSLGILLASARLGPAHTAGLGWVWAWPVICQHFTVAFGPYSAIPVAFAACQLTRFAFSSQSSEGCAMGGAVTPRPRQPSELHPSYSWMSGSTTSVQL